MRPPMEAPRSPEDQIGTIVAHVEMYDDDIRIARSRSVHQPVLLSQWVFRNSDFGVAAVGAAMPLGARTFCGWPPCRRGTVAQRHDAPGVSFATESSPVNPSELA